MPSTRSARRWIAVPTIGVIVAAVLVAAGAWSPLRAVGGLALVLFLPGYLLTLAMFPNRSRMSEGERIVLGVGLSIVASMVCGLLAAAVSHRATATNAAVILGGAGLVSGVVAWARADTESRRRTRRLGAPSVPAVVVLVVSIGVFAVSAVIVMETSSREAFTELRVSGLESRRAAVSIVNHEGVSVRYGYVIEVNGRDRREGALRVRRDRSRPLALPPLVSDDRVTVTVSRPLRKDPYRVVSFTIP